MTHLLVPDTNILWCHSKETPVDPQFDSLLKECRALVNVRLVVPEVVRDELIFQQALSARKSLAKVREHIVELSAVTATRHSLLPDGDRLRAQVEQRFSRWLRKARGRIESVPFDRIRWREVYSAAIWREPPFFLDPKNSEMERGFRDSLIAETVVLFAGAKPRLEIAFVTKDGLLSEAVERRSHRLRNLKVFDGLEAYLSHLRLMRDQRTKQLVDSLVGSAQTAFAKYWSEAVLERRIRDEFGKDFDPIHYGAPNAAYYTNMTWVAEDGGRWWLGAPEFEGSKGSTYFWRTKVTYASFWRGQIPGMSGPTGLAWLDLMQTAVKALAPERRIVVLAFAAKWSSTLAKGGALGPVTLGSISLVMSAFREPTPDELKRMSK